MSWERIARRHLSVIGVISQILPGGTNENHWNRVQKLKKKKKSKSHLKISGD